MTSHATAFTIACLQNRADNTDRGLDECVDLARAAREQGADLICTPEFCHRLYIDGDVFETGAAAQGEHAAIGRFRSLAAELGAWILVGSVAVREADGSRRNRSLLIDDEGAIVARYDKIHMFDVTLGNGETYRESARFTPGEYAVTADTPFARLGLSVCYDLRFAALYRALAKAGADVLTVPAAFTHTTGKAHWHVLLRARAIETGCYVVAPCQYGLHGKARTYGHSLVVDPWGEIIAEAGEDAAVITATIEPARVADARRRIPALDHDRTFEP